MNVRADQADEYVIPPPWRWLGAAALVAVAATAISRLRQRAREPKVAPMSDEWLRSHTADRSHY